MYASFKGNKTCGNNTAFFNQKWRTTTHCGSIPFPPHIHTKKTNKSEVVVCKRGLTPRDGVDVRVGAVLSSFNRGEGENVGEVFLFAKRVAVFVGLVFEFWECSSPSGKESLCWRLKEQKEGGESREKCEEGEGEEGSEKKTHTHTHTYVYVYMYIQDTMIRFHFFVLSVV